MKKIFPPKEQNTHDKISGLRSQFLLIPEPLKTQILIRAGLSIFSFLMIIIVAIFMHDLFLILPFIGTCILGSVNTFMLFQIANEKKYVVITGQCVEIALTMVKRIPKSITVVTDSHTVKLMLKNRMKKIPDNAVLSIYIADNTPVYQRNGMEVLHNYLAIDVKGGKRYDEDGRRPVWETEGD